MQMNELAISCNLESPQEKESKVIINIDNSLGEELLYKYMIGCNGTWSTLKDFTEEQNIEWVPREDGKYIVMVQAKKIEGDKSFDYVSRMDYLIGKVEEKLINNISLDKYEAKIGDKIDLFVDTNKFPLMFRYWLNVNDEWEMIKDYSADNTLSWAVKSEGKSEILVECKNIDSKNDFDDFKSVQFDVKPLKKVEITDFKCLNSDILKDSELIFQVDVDYDKDRTMLYKFFKINSNGEVECIQNYSTKRMVSYIENQSGQYRLLCLAKDMYSTKSFDDRAVINFEVKKYNEIGIKNFTTDISSPQLCETEVTLKAEAIGGKELLYRYIIDGSYSEDSGYVRKNNYLWKSREPGNYKITLLVKDKSFEGDYEAIEQLDFVVDEKSKDPVKIEDVIIDKSNRILKNERVKVNVNASGGIELRYCFIIRKDGEELERVKYGRGNWIEFIPKEAGSYELQIKVKDKYSDREYDSHSIVNIDVFNYIPANIDYILYTLREHYIVGDKISINAIAQDTKDVLMKYVLKINNHKVEETDFVKEKGYILIPRCSGIYTVEVFAKNVKSDKEFDCKKDITIEVNEAFPVTNTKITSNRTSFLCNESVDFNVYSDGGKDVVYEFYIMEKGDWILVQNYSKKNYYTFIPFCKEDYKILVLSKSSHNRASYEDYDIFSFKVE